MKIFVIQKCAVVNDKLIAYVDIYLDRSKIVIDKSKRAYINHYLRNDGFFIGIVNNEPTHKIKAYSIISADTNDPEANN